MLNRRGLQPVMQRRIARIWSAVEMLVTLPIRLVLSRIYAPRGVLSEHGNEVARMVRVMAGDRAYVVAAVKGGRIYTDRLTNIAVIAKRHLVPLVSWQYHKGNPLPDSENLALTNQLFIDRPPRHVNATVISLLTGGGGNHNYYHWLCDCVPRVHLAFKAVDQSRHVRYLIPEKGERFQQETLEALGISLAQCVSSRTWRHVQSTVLVATSHPNPSREEMPAWIVSFLRESFLHVASHKSKPPASEETCVYISRGDDATHRRLLNEDHLTDCLRSAGFAIYSLSGMPFVDQISLFKRARMIVAVHGAALTNLAFASRGAVVYELFSEGYQPTMYERIARLNELEYHKIVCERKGSMKRAQRADLHISDESIMGIVRRSQEIPSGKDMS